MLAFARRTSWLLGLLSLACATPGPGRSEPRPQEPIPRLDRDPSFFDEQYRHMRFSFEAGTRRLTDDDWGDLDLQAVFGFTGTHEPPDWLLGLDGGMYFFGGDDDLAAVSDVDFNGWEGFAGVMKTLHLVPDRLLLELGAGYALTYVYLDEEDEPLVFNGDDDWSSGAYARAALLLRLGDETWVGLTARGLRGASIGLEGVDLDTDYEQLAFTLAGRW